MFTVIARHNGKDLRFDIDPFYFPDGQSHFRIPEFNNFKDTVFTSVSVFGSINTVNDLWLARQISNVFRPKTPRITLVAPWIFGQRTDRRFSDGEPLTGPLVFKQLREDFTDVISFCPHNLEVFKGIFGYDDISEISFFSRTIELYKPSCIILPDKGAVKRFDLNRILSITDRNGLPKPTIIVCDKVRNTLTGEITGMKIESGEPFGNCLIIDDICDGGATFKAISQTLRTNDKVSAVGLAVFHGIFSKGKVEGIDYYATTNSYQSKSMIEKILDGNVYCRNVC